MLENGLRALLISDYSGPAAAEEDDSDGEDEDGEEEEEEEDESGAETDEEPDENGSENEDDEEEDTEVLKKKGNAEKQVLPSIVNKLTNTPVFHIVRKPLQTWH